MAFHLHLINLLLDHVPAAAPQARNSAAPSTKEPRLSLQWEPGSDGRPQSRWTLA